MDFIKNFFFNTFGNQVISILALLLMVIVVGYVISYLVLWIFLFSTFDGGNKSEEAQAIRTAKLLFIGTYSALGFLLAVIIVFIVI